MPWKYKTTNSPKMRYNLRKAEIEEKHIPLYMDPHSNKLHEEISKIKEAISLAKANNRTEKLEMLRHRLLVLSKINDLRLLSMGQKHTDSKVINLVKKSLR